MFGHNNQNEIARSSDKKVFLANYDYSSTGSFTWTEQLGEMNEDDFSELNKQLQVHESVSSINLQGNKIGTKDGLVDALTKLLIDNNQIEYINLSSNELNNSHVIRLFKSLKTLSKNIVIDFSNNPDITESVLKEVESFRLHPLTSISLIKCCFSDRNLSAEFNEHLNTANKELLELKKELSTLSEAKSAYINNPNSYSAQQLVWDFNRLGPVTQSDLFKLNEQLKKNKHITSISFYTNKIGRNAGTVDALIQILKDNPQITSVNLQYNRLLDRHIQKIIQSLSPSQLSRLYLQTNANLLTEKSLKLAYKHLDPRSVISMEFGNKINWDDAEATECSEKARELCRKRSEETADPKVSENNIFIEKAKQQDAASPKQRESSFEEKTNETTTSTPSIKNNIFKKQ
ncbi:MAG TPA: hypothetical protein VHA13_01815 [Gammaproteobacteria bacterium]|nr:hypothetical protein [Gammaproteobacteria bacterium]